MAEALRYDGLALPFANDVRHDVLQVTGVVPGGPASLGRLEAANDFLLGADDTVFASVEGFGKFVEDKRGGIITLYVYNSLRRTVRDVPLFVTTKQWRGLSGDPHEGLGLTLSYGVLHRLPPVSVFPRNEWQVSAAGRPRGGSDPEAIAGRQTPNRAIHASAATAPSGGARRARIDESARGTKLEFSPDPVLSPLIGSLPKAPVKPIPGGPEV